MKVLDFLCTKIAETIAESAVLRYNFGITNNKTNQENYTPIQMKFPVDLEYSLGLRNRHFKMPVSFFVCMFLKKSPAFI